MEIDTRDIWNRFEPKIIYEPMTGCWLWIGAQYESGYGQFVIKNKQRRAHRVSFELFKGEIPPKYIVHHLCKQSLCVNPRHLVSVLQQNHPGIASDIERNRDRCPQGHLYAGDNLVVRKNGRRECKRCRKEGGKKHYRKNKEKRLAVQKDYVERNKEKRKFYYATWYVENKERVREYRNDNKEKLNAASREKYKENPESKLANHRRWYEKNKEGYNLKRRQKYREKGSQDENRNQ